jgi:MFS family permease
MWYARHEAQLRQALFFSAASVAGAFSGLLAFGIAHMDGVGNLAGWRWIFILEGILTVIVAVIAYFTLFDFPETASFLTEEERAFVAYRLKYQNYKEEADGGVRVAQDDSFQWKFVKAAFLVRNVPVRTACEAYTDFVLGLANLDKCSDLLGYVWSSVILSIRQANRARYRVSAIRHITLPSLDYSRNWVQLLGSSTPDRTHLHHSVRIGCCCRVLQ